VSAFEVTAERARGANYYEAVTEELFGKIMSQLGGGDPRATFIDFGSGKGRQLLLASEYPFRRILGVELEPNLHRVALRNIEIYRSDTQKCREIMSLCADAMELELPPDSLVCSFYNPFDDRILREVVENLERSLRMKPREATVIYLNPVHRDVFDESPHWQIIGSSVFSGYALYRWTGSSLAQAS
jgi:predicted RNA methylase